MPGQSTYIPLEERRCTKCGRGVAGGARFTLVYPKRPGFRSYRSVCADCCSARVRADRAARRRLRAAGQVPRPPRAVAPRLPEVAPQLAHPVEEALRDLLAASPAGPERRGVLRLLRAVGVGDEHRPLRLPRAAEGGPAGDARGPEILTQRQRELLRLAANGYGNGQIARILCLGEGTVKDHLTAAYLAILGSGTPHHSRRAVARVWRWRREFGDLRPRGRREEASE